MSDVTGPISTLPGTIYPAPDNTPCDNHPDRPATRRVQGETDSFGSEMHDLCNECFAEEDRCPQKGTCDWCKSSEVVLRPQRDYEEGLYGPVYYVCQTCIDKQRRQLEDYLDDT